MVFNIEKAIQNSVGLEKEKYIQAKEEGDSWIASINSVLIKARIMVFTTPMSWYDMDRLERGEEPQKSKNQLKRERKEKEKERQKIQTTQKIQKPINVDNCFKVFVKQLHSETTIKDLLTTFGSIGRLKVFIIKDKETNKCKGTAILTFENKKCVDKAMDFDGCKIRRKAISVEYAR